MRRPYPSCGTGCTRANALLFLLLQSVLAFYSSSTTAFHINPTKIASSSKTSSSLVSHHRHDDFLPKITRRSSITTTHHASSSSSSGTPLNTPFRTFASLPVRSIASREGCLPIHHLRLLCSRQPSRSSSSRLRMSSPAPPVKPPKKRGWGGGGGGDELYVRELVEPEKSEILTKWRAYAKADGGEKFYETLNIINDMIAWRSGVVAARKRQFTLACCKGTAVQAVACVQIGPKNEDVRSFLTQEACMSLCLLTVDPASPQFKAGAHLCKELKEIGRLENMAVSFQPIKNIYSGRFYVATLTM